MITVSCPLRISLAGGSTDHPKFIEKYKTGSVISFPCNLKVYASLHQDKLGVNSVKKYSIINYSKQERVINNKNIKNDVIRNCLEYFNLENINCSLTSDIFSNGTGLASSSAYLLALIKAISLFKNIKISNLEVCSLAEKIERSFNPLVGQQDFYGSLEGLKRINFFQGKQPELKQLPNNIFHKLNCYLLYTGVHRSSTKILETIDIDKSFALLDDVNKLEYSLLNNDIKEFNNIIKTTWKNKKLTSPHICSNKHLIKIDNKLSSDNRVLSHKLCGAGNGGFFIFFCSSNTKNIVKDYNNTVQIFLSNDSINYEILF
jgi:D-glycero-alpha-D-manno-heptose-7-phosphate kinase